MRLRPVLARGLAAFALVVGVAGAAPVAGLPGTPVQAVSALRHTLTAWADGEQQWIESWAAPSQRMQPLNVRDQTIRLVLRPHSDGTRVRLRLVNRFSALHLTLDAVTIAVRSQGAAVAEESVRPVTFGGGRSVTLSPGGSRRSDEVDFEVRAGRDLAVSMYVRGAAAVPSGHRNALQTSYLSSPGDHSTDADASAYTGTTTTWPLLDSLSVWATAPGTIVAVGDSITDGIGSSPDANRRWTDHFAERLAGHAHYGVVNAGISGNRVLRDGAGQSALHRFERDVLTRPAVRYVVLLEGINDLNLDSRTGRAEQIIAGYRALISAAHDRGIRIVGGTLTPVGGSPLARASVESQRQRVNHWIRTSGQFDGVVDFDRATRDPADPLRLRPNYDCGDHLHPSDAGYRAMAAAAAVDLKLFR